MVTRKEKHGFGLVDISLGIVATLAVLSGSIAGFRQYSLNSTAQDFYQNAILMRSDILGTMAPGQGLGSIPGERDGGQLTVNTAAYSAEGFVGRDVRVLIDLGEEEEFIHVAIGGLPDRQCDRLANRIRSIASFNLGTRCNDDERGAELQMTFRVINPGRTSPTEEAGEGWTPGPELPPSEPPAPPPPPPPPPPAPPEPGGEDEGEDEVTPPEDENGTPPGHGGTPPGHGGTPPGQGGTPPGHGGTPPGQGGTPPGQGGTPPGHGGTPPGQGGDPDPDEGDSEAFDFILTGASGSWGSSPGWGPTVQSPWYPLGTIGASHGQTMSVSGGGNPTFQNASGQRVSSGALGSGGFNIEVQTPACGETHEVFIVLGDGRRGFWDLAPRPEWPSSWGPKPAGC